MTDPMTTDPTSTLTGTTRVVAAVIRPGDPSVQSDRGGLAMRPLDCERGEDAFHDRVVPHVAGAAHDGRTAISFKLQC